MIIYFRAWCFIIIFLSLSACASQHGVSTLDDLTISARNDGVLTKPINLHYPLQTRFLSVNGQLPVPGPGSSCLASSFRPANSIICFSASDDTQIQVRRYVYEGSREDLFNLQEDLTELQLKLVELIAENTMSTSQNNDGNTTSSSLAKKAQTVTDKAMQIASDIDEKNVFIFRWQAENRANSDTSLGSLLTGFGETQRSERGLVIVGGLTVSQLLLGLNDYQSELKKYPKGTKIATLTMGAEHLIYFTGTDLSTALSATLDGDIEDLFQNLSPETQVALNAYAAIGRAHENQGNFSAPSVQNYSLDTYQSENPNQQTKRPNQQIFYSTMTDIETLLDSLSDSF